MAENALAGARALVTGGAGFIGSHLVDALIAAGIGRVQVVDDLSLGTPANLRVAISAGAQLTQLDCCDLDALRRAVGHEPVDFCFNLAVIPLPASLVDPRANVERNVAMTTAACEMAREGRVRRLVQYSSSEVYGTAQTAPMAESHPIAPHTPYAAAKAATDLVAMSYATTFGVELVTVRPFNTYGERQSDGAYAGLIPAVVRRVRAGAPVLIHGDGEQTRDMTYVSDTVAGTLAAAAADSPPPQPVNLGSGVEVSVNEMVRLLLDSLGCPDHPIEHVQRRPGDVRRLLADITLAREALGYQPHTLLEDGLQRTVEWYLTRAA